MINAAIPLDAIMTTIEESFEEEWTGDARSGHIVFRPDVRVHLRVEHDTRAWREGWPMHAWCAHFSSCAQLLCVDLTIRFHDAVLDRMTLVELEEGRYLAPLPDRIDCDEVGESVFGYRSTLTVNIGRIITTSLDVHHPFDAFVRRAWLRLPER